MSTDPENSGINPLYATTTTIKYPDSDGHGTGFYFNQAGETYLVTNRHVLKDEDEDGNMVHNPDSIRVFIRGHPDISQVSYFDIDLSDGEGNNWFSHPNQPDVDIAVVPINRRLSSLSGDDIVTGSLAFSSDHFLSDPDRIQGGDSALISGYPGMLAGTNMNLPVLRDARIASPYGVNFDGSPYFVTDARMHSGTSGSPVLASPSSMTHSSSGDMIVGGPQTALLGVHSATFKQDVEDVGEEWLDLNVAWYAEAIPDIINSF